MRWQVPLRSVPQNGDTREFTRFSWLPTRIGLTMVWLERYLVIEEWRNATSLTRSGWVERGVRTVEPKPRFPVNMNIVLVNLVVAIIGLFIGYVLAAGSMSTSIQLVRLTALLNAVMGFMGIIRHVLVTSGRQ